MRRAVFLDRDGVLNRAIIRDGRPYPPSDLKQLEILPGVAESLRRLHAAGFLLVVVTNQPDVARGVQKRETVEAVNTVLRAGLPIDDFKVCYHDDRDKCGCRKPHPGLLNESAREMNIDLGKSYMIGDRWRDIEAGERAGCTTILICDNYVETGRCEPTLRAASLLDGVEWILSRT